MKRWSNKQGATIENPAIDRFMNELNALCERHGFTIEHEDSHGAFIIVPYAGYAGPEDAFDDT